MSFSNAEESFVRTSFWRKRFALVKNRLYLYPAPDPLPHTRWFWMGMALVMALVTAFSIFFIVYLTRMQDAFRTPAEDMGIMDQAIWSLTHGQLFHQTICNIVNDTNCYSVQGISRFAIHFEPILFPLSFIYLLWPGPKILMIVQTLVVASGAFPAFWLARLRLRNEVAGVVIAALYLLYPSLQQAEVSYFHAVAFTSAFLLFTLYFMYTRRTLWMFVFAVLALACKEEMPLVIAMFGLWTLIFQQRWRSGLGLVGLAVAWVGLDLLIFRVFSPVGHPLLASRFAYLGSGPFEIIRNILLHPVSLIKAHVLEHDHFFYLRLLLSSVNYLALLAPWVLILAVPSIALNLLSSDPNQYQGLYQYNAEIVPVLIFATIESMVVILWVIQGMAKRLADQRAQVTGLEGAAANVVGKRRLAWAHIPGPRWFQLLALFFLLGTILFGVLRHDQTYGVMPFSQGYVWPQITAHDEMAQHFIDMIPATASVVAQSSLVPHMSQRANIYLYPYAVGSSDYVLLDVTSDTYPFAPHDYIGTVKKLLLHGEYGIVASQDGYILLKHGLSAPGLAPESPVSTGLAAQPNLPEAFCSFTQVSPQSGTTLAQVNFHAQGSGTISLVGFQVQMPGAFFKIITYWKVNQAGIPPLNIHASLLNDAGQEVFSSEDFPGATWCPTNTWQPGKIVQMSTNLMYIGNVPKGHLHVALALLPISTTSTTMNSNTEGLPFQVVQAPNTVSAVQGKNLLQLQTLNIS